MRRSLLALAFCLPIAAGAQEQSFEILLQDGVSPFPSYGGTRDVTLGAPPSESDDAAEVNRNLEDNEADGFPEERAILLRWDLSGVTLPGPITAAKIVVSPVDGTNSDYALYAMKRSWTASEATWSLAANGAPWGVEGALKPDVDFDSEPIGVLLSGTGEIVFNAAGHAKVQQWLATPAENFGVVLRNPYAVNGITFRSSENASTSERPGLVLIGGGETRIFRNGVTPEGYAGNTDTHISSPPPENENGGGLLVAGVNELARALLRFDVSIIPADATIESAELRLHVDTSSGVEVSVFEVLREWDEDEANWTRATRSTPWTAEGGSGADDIDHDLITAFAFADEGQAVIPLDSAGRDLVEAWVRGTRPNHGFMLARLEESGNPLAVLDREAQEPTQRPALFVRYKATQQYRDAELGTCGCSSAGAPLLMLSFASLTLLARVIRRARERRS